MKIRRWVSQRGPGFIIKRTSALLGRYGIRADRAEARIESLMAVFARHGCAPTFPTPGRVVASHSQFIRGLQDAGAEIAVHSYDHLDLKGYKPEEARAQLEKGACTFERYGIENHGFRCPYLSCTPELVEVLPSGLFGYSSNDAVSWDLGAPAAGKDRVVWQTIKRFYDPRPASADVAVPRMRHGMVEIPVTVPDDLQLHDGLGLGTDGLTAAWIELLDQVYRRGEIFTLLFHPELAERCLEPFDALLSNAEARRPCVWLARLRDVRDWWCEKQDCSFDLIQTAAGWRVAFICTDRATILVRGVPGAELAEAGTPWYGPYWRLHSKALEVAGVRLPLVGVTADVPAQAMEFLKQQGYILQTGPLAAQCTICLDASVVTAHTTQVALIDYIESCPGPLVRYWRWPDGARSALSITGDLDALTLGDYASRLFVH